MRASSGLRRHSRFSIDFAAGEGARLRDISLSGMRVLTNRAMRIDESVETTLKTSYGLLRLKGRIVRGMRSGLQNLPYEYGIEFDTMESASEVVLRGYLDDLARRGAAAPEVPLEELDFRRLQERVAELEALPEGIGKPGGQEVKREQLAHAEDSVNEGLAPVAVEDSIDETVLNTDFDYERFSYLVKLGQQLMPLVKDCPDRLAGDDCRSVAQSFDSRFSLETVRSSTQKQGFGDESIMAILFTFYERNLIDFA